MFLMVPHCKPDPLAAIVVDASSGEVLYAKRADDLRYPASITKIMTLYLTFEALSTGRLRPTDLVPVSEHGLQYGALKIDAASRPEPDRR